ncbi:MAG: energy-coupling factor transporter ATPase [Eubacteriales bacterium]|nr:energy-coupling factor transporter ATPase [bacterium]MDY2791868.1 energy-coupling factor transporter ATPase [Eubacteriales bacterium]
MPIEIKQLKHVYMPGSPFETAALNELSLTIHDGEFVGVIGHTGSGKSTLIMHLNGLLKPTSGTVIVDGLDLSSGKEQLREVRRRVGLVFQYPEYQLFEETVLKDVMFGPKNQGLSDEEAEKCAREALRMVGLTDEKLYSASPFELSGGQKRRAAIAGVVAMKPQTLILDEPAAGLDPRGREEILSLIRRIHENGARTLIMVSHSMTDVSRLCSRILVLSHGSLVADGTPREVFSDTTAIREAGLELPECARLAERLREEGFPVPPGAFTREDVKRAILQAFGKEG